MISLRQTVLALTIFLELSPLRHYPHCAFSEPAYVTDDPSLAWREHLLATIPPDSTYLGAVFSHAGAHVAYAIETRGNDFIVADEGKASKPYDAVRLPVFSVDGKQLAYSARKGSEWVLVLGDKSIGGPYDAVGVPVFSPDSKQLAYSARKGSEWVLVLGDKSTSMGSCMAMSLTFNPVNHEIAYRTRKGQIWYIVAGEKKGSEYDYVGMPVYSQDGAKLLYVAERKDTWFLVSDNKSFVESSKPIIGPIVSHKNHHMAYIIANGHCQSLVVGQLTSENYDMIWEPMFSSDCDKVAYGAKKGNELWWKIMDLPGH